MSESQEKEEQSYKVTEQMGTNKQINNRQSLSQVKKAKKQIDEDAKLLANRIALLKQEEIKTVKKIEDTKRKAYQIYKAKQANESKQSERIKQQEEIYIRQDQVRKAREMQAIEKHNKKQIWVQVKQEHYEQIKNLKEQYRVKKAANDKQAMTTVQGKSKMVRESKETGKAKIDSFQIQKRYQVQQEFARQYQEEELRRKRKVNELVSMEKLEWELIQKLQQTQGVQKQAYKELEDAIQLNAQEFEDKFINNEKEDKSKASLRATQEQQPTQEKGEGGGEEKEEGEKEEEEEKEVGEVEEKVGEKGEDSNE